jgi:hypothetical protein
MEETPSNIEVIDALKTILEANILGDSEIDFINECMNNDNPIMFLQNSLQKKEPVAISIYVKLDNNYNEIEKNKN